MRARPTFGAPLVPLTPITVVPAESPICSALMSGRGVSMSFRQVAQGLRLRDRGHRSRIGTPLAQEAEDTLGGELRVLERRQVRSVFNDFEP